jgi:uncharacterized protein (DUF433 family)
VKLPITIDPEIMSGQPVFTGTRVPVETLIGYLLDGNTLDEFLDDFPTVKREDAVCVLKHAGVSLLHPLAARKSFSTKVSSNPLNPLPPEALHPVTFNGKELPLAAYWLELLGPILNTLPDDLCDWLLDLHYCGGQKRTLSSEIVVAYCQTLDVTLRQHRDQILQGLKSRLPWSNPEQMLNDWSVTLEIIRSSALTRSKCIWTRPSFVKKSEAAKFLDFLKRSRED